VGHLEASQVLEHVVKNSQDLESHYGHQTKYKSGRTYKLTQSKDRDYKHVAQRVLGIMQEQRERRRGEIQCQEVEHLVEENTFYILRTDTKTILAKGIIGYEAAKERANRFRKAMNLRWDQIQFKAEHQTTTPKQFGVSADGRNYTNAR